MYILQTFCTKRTTNDDCLIFDLSPIFFQPKKNMYFTCLCLAGRKAEKTRTRWTVTDVFFEFSPLQTKTRKAQFLVWRDDNGNWRKHEKKSTLVLISTVLFARLCLIFMFYCSAGHGFTCNTSDKEKLNTIWPFWNVLFLNNYFF